MATTPNATDPQAIPQPDFWTTLASVLGNGAAGRASGRQIAAGLNVNRDQLLNQQYTQGSTNAFNQAKFQLDAPSERAGQAVRGDILANSQDATFTGLPDYVKMPTVSGGLRPSMLSDTTRQAGRDLTSLAASQMGKDRIDYPNAPPIQPIPDASLLESIMGAGSTTAGILSALSPLAKGGSGGGGDPIKAIEQLIKRIRGPQRLPSHPTAPSYGGLPGGSPSGNMDGYDDAPEPTGEVTTRWGVAEPDWDTYGDQWWYDENGYPTYGGGGGGNDGSEYY